MFELLPAAAGAAAAGRNASGRRRPAAAMLAAALGAWLGAMSSAPAQAFEVAAQPPTGAVCTQPDPFQKLRKLDEGSIASTWSSVPDAAGCADVDRSHTGHVQMLADSSGDDATGGTGGTDGTGSFDLLQPRYRLQADATVLHGWRGRADGGAAPLQRRGRRVDLGWQRAGLAHRSALACRGRNDRAPDGGRPGTAACSWEPVRRPSSMHRCSRRPALWPSRSCGGGWASWNSASCSASWRTTATISTDHT